MEIRAILRTLTLAASGAVATFRRFRMPLACAVLAATVIITEFHGVGVFGEDWTAVRVFAFFALGLLFSLSLSLLAESVDWTPGQHRLVGVTGFGLLALYVYSVPAVGQPSFMGTFIYLGAALVLFVGCAPFRFRIGDDGAAWHFNRLLWQSIGFSWLSAFILFLGLALGLYSYEHLLMIEIPGIAYGDTFVACMGIVWPWLALSGIPGQFGSPKSDRIPEHLRILVGYILVPLSLGYLAILYAYMALIGAQWELPRGNVAFIVAGCSVLGVATHLLAYPQRTSGGALVRLFYRHFYRALILPVVLLGIAIGTRIDAYGFTENRFAVAILAIWLAAVALHFSLSSRPRILWVPLSLCAMLALASIGPWGAADVSTRSQVQRFAALLADNGLLVDGKIVAAEHDVPWQAREDISMAVGFIKDSERLQYIRPWFDSSRLDFDGDPSAMAIVATLGFEYIPGARRAPRFSYQTRTEMTFDIRGFDMLARANFHGSNGNWSDTTEITPSGEMVTIGYDRDRNVLAVYVANEVVQFDFRALVERLEQGRGQGVDQLMTLEKAKGTLRVRLYVHLLRGAKDDGRVELDNLDITLLVGRIGERS